MILLQITVCLLGIAATVEALPSFESCLSASDCCPSDWRSWGKSCYRVSSQALPWIVAKTLCQNTGGEMAAPHSLAENEFFVNLAVHEASSVKRLWMGCSYKESEGEWICQGQEKGDMFTQWNPGSPNSSNENAHCALLVADPNASVASGDWIDRKCGLTVTYPFVCVQRQQFTRRLCFSAPFRLDCLINQVTHEFVTKSVASCASACIMDPECRSFNIKITGQGQRLCQLNGRYTFNDPLLFQETGPPCVFYAYSACIE